MHIFNPVLLKTIEHCLLFKSPNFFLCQDLHGKGTVLYIYIYTHTHTHTHIHTLFMNGPGDKGQTPGQVIPKIQKMVLDTSLFNIQHYKVCHHHHHVVSPAWISLTLSRHYRSSFLAGPQGYIPYPHRAVVCRFKLVVLLLLGHIRGSIGVHHLWYQE